MENQTFKATIQLLEDSSKTLKSIISYLKSIISHKANLQAWKDTIGMDLLHYCILTKRVGVMEYLFSHGCFPQSYKPAINPYAHLAAMLGHKDCLKVILQYRPSDYFTLNQDSACLFLPQETKRRLHIPITMNFKLLKSSSSIRIIRTPPPLEPENNINEYLESALKSENDILAEEKLAKSKPSKTLNNPNATERSSRIFKVVIKDPNNLNILPDKDTIRGEKLKKLKKKGKNSKQIFLSNDFSDTNVKKCQKHLTPVHHFQAHIPPIKVNRHMITVHSTVLDNYDDEGVVRGAGTYVQKLVKLKPREESKELLTERDIILSKSDSQNSQSADFNYNRLQSYLQYLEEKNSAIAPPQISNNNLTVPHASESKSVNINEYHVSSNNVSSGIFQKSKAVQSPKEAPKGEDGIRGIKKYKLLEPKLANKNDVSAEMCALYLGKSPLTIAAEYGHIECVYLMLEMVVLKKKHQELQNKSPLYLAVVSQSIETIKLLMSEKSITKEEYTSAVGVAMRSMSPECLKSLLVYGSKARAVMFNGINLFHLLYTEMASSKHLVEMLPVMTKTLLKANEPVNITNTTPTHPLYTLISCAFSFNSGRKLYYFVECLEMLLQNKANPFHQEEKPKNKKPELSRRNFSSAIECVTYCAKQYLDQVNNKTLAKFFMKKFIISIVKYDMTPRKSNDDILFNYIAVSDSMGLDPTIIRCLLRYGANPDATKENKFAINAYFDVILQYLSKFEINSYDKYLHEIEVLMVIVQSMSNLPQYDALAVFLTTTIANNMAPLQALPLVKYFAYLMKNAAFNPQSLVNIVAHQIWVRLHRNFYRVRALPLPLSQLNLVIP